VNRSEPSAEGYLLSFDQHNGWSSSTNKMDLITSNLTIRNEQVVFDSFLLSRSIDTTVTSPESLIYLLIFWIIVLRYLYWILSTEGGRKWLEEQGAEGHEVFAETVPFIVLSVAALLVANCVGGLGWMGIVVSGLSELVS
jgi:hypothetical protein